MNNTQGVPIAGQESVLTPAAIPLSDMFGEVLRWNIMFGVPVPGTEYNRMIDLIKEEWAEFKTATTDQSRADALADLVVVILGACARLVSRPVISGRVQTLLRQNWKSVTLDDQSISPLYDEIGRGFIDKSAADFLELLFIYCRAQNIDIVSTFRQVMKANWTKYWTAEEVKNSLPLGCVAMQVGGIVVKNRAGKIQKPPSFLHP